MSDGYRIERDSMGEMQVPEDALYAAQTQRAVLNFPISGITIPRGFIRALGLVKWACAETNEGLGLLDAGISKAVKEAAHEVADGKWDAHFPIDIFQTGSGTSSNMNSNEVIATRATQIRGEKVHPNDHVNMSQSSNDVIPTAIHVSALLETQEQLIPALEHLSEVIAGKMAQVDHVTKTGRTHLMDAMPVRLSQELSGWQAQIDGAIKGIEDAVDRVAELAIGGTAVGTGVNCHPDFGTGVCNALNERTGQSFRASPNRFMSIASQDAAVGLSGALKVLACAYMKIANDLRWMNSGPIAGLGEIALEALQPGSSIMPGKINPVVPEAACMVAAQIIGNDTAITVGGQAGNFQLNVMLPMVGYNLLQSIEIAANTGRLLADRAIATFTVNEDTITGLVDKNPILVTALNRVIGYDLGAKIAKQAYAERRPLKEVALELTDLSREQLDDLLDPRKLTEGGV